jgi:nucleotide-binding universal stress UspA family protein
MFQKVLLAVALQHWEVPTSSACAARDVAIQLVKGSWHPLYVLTIYSYQLLPIVQPPLIGPEAVPVSERILSAEEEAVRAAVEAKLRAYVQPIEHAGVSVVRLIRPGSPREEVVHVAAEIRADCLVIGAHSQRHVFDLGGTAQAICRRARAVVVLASPSA